MTYPPSAQRGAFIAGVDYVLPPRRVTNDDLAALHPDWQVPQVAARTGVHSRHWCTAEETALDLGVQASERLFSRTGFDRSAIDAVLFCTQTPDHVMPPNSTLLQHRLGLSQRLLAMDFTLACSGYVYGIEVARAFVEAGSASQVLVVAAETYSKLCHPDDRGPTTLFGDGGAATIVSGGERRIGRAMLGTDGGRGDCFIVPAGGARQPRSAETARLASDASGNFRTAEHVMMNGGGVLDFIKKDVPPLVRELLAREGLTLADIDLVLFHQASKMSIDYLHRALKIPEAKQFTNLANIGNTVSASIPIALRDAEVAGRLTSGMRVLLVGFGVGLSWGGQVITW